ncbi:MAG: SMC-Scp complex subunit ScpB [Alicyclobacillus sp.]|nr:SMC-Scp complex subunit ScpB [Alicyclobacillus sp.]
MPMTAALEAVLFAAGQEGMTTRDLAGLFQISEAEARSWCLQLQEAYASREGGLAVMEVAGAWQIVTRPEYAPYLSRMASAPTSQTLSAAALEVLAIVAYQQPVSRADIEAIRGVQSDRVLNTLVHRQLIREVGRQEAPGRPILYGTTDTFLQVFGLRSLKDLPPIPADQEAPQDLQLFQFPPALPRD